MFSPTYSNRTVETAPNSPQGLEACTEPSKKYVLETCDFNEDCPKCGNGFSREKDLKNHLSNEHPSMVLGKVNSRWNCPICIEFNYTDNKSATEHVMSNHVEHRSSIPSTPQTEYHPLPANANRLSGSTSAQGFLPAHMYSDGDGLVGLNPYRPTQTNLPSHMAARPYGYLNQYSQYPNVSRGPITMPMASASTYQQPSYSATPTHQGYGLQGRDTNEYGFYRAVAGEDRHLLPASFERINSTQTLLPRVSRESELPWDEKRL